MKVNELTLRADHWRQIEAHLRQALPEEACGLVGGSEGRSEIILPVENAEHSAVRFRMAPQEQWRAFQVLEEKGLDLLAIFHSHPAGPSKPSETDVAEFAYPGVYSLICARMGEQWLPRAFSIEGGVVNEVRLAIV